MKDDTTAVVSFTSFNSDVLSIEHGCASRLWGQGGPFLRIPFGRYAVETVLDTQKTFHRAHPHLARSGGSISRFRFETVSQGKKTVKTWPNCFVKRFTTFKLWGGVQSGPYTHTQHMQHTQKLDGRDTQKGPLAITPWAWACGESPQTQRPAPGPVQCPHA